MDHSYDRGKGLGAGRWAAFVAAALLLACSVIFAPVAQAQSSVRVPGQPLPLENSEQAAGGVVQHGPAAISDMWRDVRREKEGLATIGGPEAGVLIQSEGLEWRAWRNSVVANYGGWLLTGVIGVVALFFLIKGRMKIEGGRSGRVIPRFSLVQRIVHWFVAVLFVVLGVTGLILLFGRDVLMPVLGPSSFAVIASASMEAHNLFGPLFFPAILAMLFAFAKGNGLRLADLRWLAKAGGFFGGHASSHKYNLGEKVWFWWAVAAGLVLSVSGFALLFPWVLADRGTAQIANLLHAAAALGFIAIGLGHIYLGTLGMEGALEGMTTGAVDENWAKEHHDLWWQDHKGQATSDTVKAAVAAAAHGDLAIEVGRS